MKKIIASVTVAALAGTLSVQAGQLSEGLHNAHEAAGAEAAKSGQAALDAAGKAIAPVIYAGKAIVNGVEFVILKTAQGTIMVAEAAVRGLEIAVEGAKFVALKTAEGVLWVAEKALEAGELLVDVAIETTKIVVDGVVYVAARLADGVVFVAEAAMEAAKATGELIVRGTKFVVRKTKQGIVFVAKGAMNAARAARRAAKVAELRTNLAGALAVGGVGGRTMAYFQKAAGDRDATVARVAKACLAAGEAFNNVY